MSAMALVIVHASPGDGQMGSPSRYAQPLKAQPYKPQPQPYNSDLSRVIAKAIREAAKRSPSPQPQKEVERPSDEALTDVNAISHGQCKPTVRQIVAHAKKAMLWITVLDDNDHPIKSGTGFFIDELCGVLTNYHVIEKGKHFTAQIISSGKTLSNGYLDDSNRSCDVAVLRFPGYDTDGWKNILT
jgi:S1-C subfamily serine protease